jgi:3-hydroxyisobutyrate dehydrogenase-like beta-hydroxyacid dehydrogenase
MNKRIGFIGLGQMGRWMALNLIKAQFDLTVFDIRSDACATLEKAGAASVGLPSELAEKTDWIFLSLPNSNVVEEVVLGNHGIIHGSKAGKILIDCGTAEYLWTKEFATRVADYGIRFVDAPVTGMAQRAEDAALTFMFGGPKELLADIQPAFEAMGTEIFHMGAVGNGQLAKMINNILFNTNLAALAEVLPMAVKLGLEPAKIAQVINKGTGRSFASDAFLPNILEGRFDQGYPLDQAYKDMVQVGIVSVRNHIPVPMVHTALSTYQTALGLGLGKEDKGAMIKVFERLLDVTFRQKTD